MKESQRNNTFLILFKILLVCKPKEECVNITSELQNLEEGFVALMDNNGCCPFINKTCQPELCPTKNCPEFYVPVKKADSLCCPVMECGESMIFI